MGHMVLVAEIAENLRISFVDVIPLKDGFDKYMVPIHHQGLDLLEKGQNVSLVSGFEQGEGMEKGRISNIERENGRIIIEISKLKGRKYEINRIALPDRKQPLGRTH
jgi:hypothetical protein